MSEFRGDQASGLRRLLTRDETRVVAVAGGCRGVGATTAVVNIGAALAATGHQVLAIDEIGGVTSVAGVLGLHPRLDLRNVTRRQCELEDVLMETECGITVLPAGQSAQGLPALRHLDEQRLLENYAQLGSRFDIALIDSRNRGAAGLLSRMVHDVVVVAAASASAVTGAYSFIKRAASYRDHQRFHILVNDVGIGSVAQLVFRNLERAARAYLDMPLANLGWVPRDNAVRKAASRKQPVVAAFPAAAATRGFGSIASSMASWPSCRNEDCVNTLISPRISGGVPGWGQGEYHDRVQPR